MRFDAGKQIGNYTLIKRLGRGGFGEVWLAERKSKFVTTKVAVKLPLDAQVDIEAIKSEAVLWEQASGHPNVLPIIEADEHDGQILIVSEYAPDGSLEDLMQREGVLNIRQAIELTIGILSGLEFLHSRQIIHRDIKPANILLQGETPRLADFGVSRVMKTTSASMNMSGTPAYMAPEAFDGKRSVQTDVWSVGVMLYQMLKGSLPFPHSNITDLIGGLFMRQPEPMPDFVPPALQRIIFKSLAKNPDERYQSARLMRDELGQFLITISHRDIQPTLRHERVPETVWQEKEQQTVTDPNVETPTQDSRARTHQLNGDSTRQNNRHPDFNVSGTNNNKKPGKSKLPVFLGLGIGLVILLGLGGGLATLAWWKLKPQKSDQKIDIAVNEPKKTPSETDKKQAFILADQALNNVKFGEFTTAQKMAQDAVQFDDSLPLALAIRGYTKTYLGNRKEDHEAARIDLEKAAQLAPTNALFQAWLIEVYEKLEQTELARKAANNVLSRLSSPSSDIDYYARAKGNIALNNQKEAITDLTKAIELNSLFVAAYNNRGSVYDSRYQYDLALDDYNRAINLNPKFPPVYSNRAKIYYLKKDYDSSIKDCDKAIELNPQFVIAYIYRGANYEKKKLDVTASIDYGHAIDINPQDPVPYRMRADVNERLGFKDLAAADRQKYEELGGK